MEENRKMIAMSSEEYDQFMCKRFPQFFAQRNQSQMETCMCWGFEIGNGWYPVLFELCKRLEVLCTPYNIALEFEQIKEKFGSARFYYSLGLSEAKIDTPEATETLSVVNETIRDLVSEYENKCDKICAMTGRYYKHKISTGWVYDICIEAWLEMHKNNPVQKQIGLDIVNRLKTIDKVKEMLYRCDFETVKEALAFVEEKCKTK